LLRGARRDQRTLEVFQFQCAEPCHLRDGPPRSFAAYRCTAEFFRRTRADHARFALLLQAVDKSRSFTLPAEPLTHFACNKSYLRLRSPNHVPVKSETGKTVCHLTSGVCRLTLSVDQRVQDLLTTQASHITSAWFGSASGRCVWHGFRAAVDA
jgi:hypothetical protein